MPRLLWLITALLVASAVACGGDDAAADKATSAPGSSPASAGAAAQPASDGGASAPAASGASATFMVADETFQFEEIKCSFGTGIIQGPGTSLDGSTPAFIYGGLPKDAQGKPVLDQPEGVEFDLKVGLGELYGMATYEYKLQSSLGSVSEYSDDGKHTTGSADFFYEAGTGAKQGLNESDLVAGTWDVTCP
jgi:hypothetical protein